MSKILRHQDLRIQPFDNGGWCLCDDIIRLEGHKDTCLFADQRNSHFLYNLMYHNDKQRFQLAVVTVDNWSSGGDNRRAVTQIYAIR
eukprot:9078864-Heterocapsa_arctica.AAC.1